MKTIDVVSDFKKYLKETKDMPNSQYSKYYKDYASFEIKANVNYSYQINDNLDVVVEISSQLEKKLNAELQKIVPGTDMTTFLKIF